MQQHDSQQLAPHAPGIDWSATRQHATKQRASIQREVLRLLDDLAPERPPPRHEAPSTAVRAYRWPSRCILQGESHAISVSWFPGGVDDGSLGEMMVIAWDGVVSLPGSGRRIAEQAQAVRSLLLHPEETSGGGWEWRSEQGATAFGTAALAMYCREQLERS